MKYQVFVYDTQEEFYGCIGEYDTLEEAKKRAEEVSRACKPIYYLDVLIEENND